MKLQQRFASFLLCLVIMITGLVGYIPGYATETLTNGNLSMANSQIESETLSDSTIVDSNIAANETAAVGSEKILLPDIVKEDINASQFIGRSPAKETNLNTFVFKNQDGTQTMKVYSHPVKYIDEKGKVQDISTDIKLNANGTFETKANSIKTTFSKVLKDGITLKHDMVNIRLVSDKLSNAKLSEDNKIVSYVYDDKTTLEYSLTYTGFKEDIIVNEYTGQTEYEFTLHTNGLTLVKENGSYFLKDSKNNIKATIGDIIIFTADERNNTFGDMTHETIIANQEYVITIHVDSAYLKDSKTKYPIRIDPTIEINYDEDGAGAIEDVTLNQNTTYAGTSGSLYVGRSTDGSLNRVLMRFPNLSLTGITASQITDANVEIRDIMCQSDEDMVIECRPYLSTAPSWSESQTVTWNSVGSSFYGSIIDSHEVSYGQGNATGSGSSHRYRFDITSLACNWAAGTQSPAKGIVFKATNTFENQTGDNIQHWKKTFASYNRSSNKPSLSMSYIPGISINASESSVVDGNSITLTATTNSNSPISWTSSHQGIAIVDSNGVVSGIKAGSAVITASVTENGVTISDTCTVYVTIENGVYYIKNNNSSKYLQAEDYGLDNMDMILQNDKYPTASSEQVKLSQMWKIYYIGSGYYTIRPMSKLDMRWDYADLELMLFKQTDADILSNTDEYTRWIIENTSGYTIKNASCENVLQIENSSTSNNAYAVLDTAVNNNNCKWTLEKIDSVPSGVVLYDKTTKTPASGFTRYISPEESLGYFRLKLDAAAYSPTSNSQSVLTWTSSNTNIATVDSEGTVVGIAPRTATITVAAYNKSFSYTINVTPIANGVYFLQNKQSTYFADIKNQVMANGTVIHQWKYHGGNTQKWIFTHVGDGYYTILSGNTEGIQAVDQYYLGVKNDSTTVNDDIVLRYGSLTDGMKWKITVTDSGAYRLTPKNGESYDYALATSSSSATNGARLMQGEYWDNNSYCDEWHIVYKLSYVHYYDSTFVNDTTMIQNISEANIFADMVFAQWFHVGIDMDGTATKYSTVIENCPYGENNSCSDACGLDCDASHHKNGLVISNQIYYAPREKNHIYVLWTNHDYETYCNEDSGVHKNESWIAVVYGSRPVIHFMTIKGSSTVKLACMALNLVHETAHVFGMPDVYNNAGHDKDKATHCVMEKFDSSNAYAFYQDVLNNRKEPFCSSCKASLSGYTENITIPGN